MTHHHNGQPCAKDHTCSDDPSEKARIVQQIRELMKHLENTPCIPRPGVPPNLKFLEKKQPRYVEDPDSIPLITHVPFLEIRPTSEYKRMVKTKDQMPNVVYIDVPPAQSPHASPPWALPTASGGSSTAAKEPELLPCPPRKGQECVCCPPNLPKLKMPD